MADLIITGTGSPSTLRPGSGHVFSGVGSLYGGGDMSGAPSLTQIPTFNAEPVAYGAKVYCCFYPPFEFNYFDQEPGAFQTTASEIKGLTTGVKKLGSMLQMAFVGEPVDLRWYGAEVGAHDWGDGSGGGWQAGDDVTSTDPAYLAARDAAQAALQAAIDQLAYQLSKPNQTDEQVIGEVYRARQNLENARRVFAAKIKELHTTYGLDTPPQAASFTHTYTAPGLYWVKFLTTVIVPPDPEADPPTDETATVTANAARLMKVVYRPLDGVDGPAGVSRVNEPIYQHEYPYPAIVEPETQGGVETAFSIQFSLDTKGTWPADLYVGFTEPRGGGALFMEQIENGVVGHLEIVGGGFISNRSGLLKHYGNDFTGTLYDMMYWMQIQQMREQQYDDITSAALAALAPADSLGLGDDATGDIDLVNFDFTTLGYVANHFLPTNRPDYAAAHIVQHMRLHVKRTNYSAASPPMFNTPTSSDYGNLAQFTNFMTDPEFDERIALGGFHAFSVGNGSVLGNIRQLVENTGSIFYSRADMSFVLEQKPYYKKTLPIPAASFVLEDGLDDTLLNEGTPQPIYKVQVEKPVLGVTAPTGETPQATITRGPKSLSYSWSPFSHPSSPWADGHQVMPDEWPYWWVSVGNCFSFAGGDPKCGDDLINYYNATAKDFIAFSSQSTDEFASNFAWSNPQTVGGGVSDQTASDALSQSVDYSLFQWEHICGEPGGQIIGPVTNVYTDNLELFAVGLCREKQAHFSFTLPVANMNHLQLGQIVDVTYATTDGFLIDWVAKKFWVINQTRLVNNTEVTNQVEILEVFPEETIEEPSGQATPPNGSGGVGNGCLTPVNVPQSVHVLGGTLTAFHVTLEWTNQTGARASDKISVYDGTGALLASFMNGTSTQGTLSYLIADTDYTVRLKSENACGNSDYSAPLSFHTLP